MVEEFIQALSRLSIEVSIQVDAPDDPSGEAWIDITSPGFSTSVSYRPAHGFGIYVSEAGYGEGPDEIFRVAETAARRVAQLYAHAADDSEAAVLTLADIRALAGFTQVQVASALRITQPSVQKTERRQNIQMDTLANYAEAMGGRLEARLVFDEMEVRLPTKRRKGHG